MSSVRLILCSVLFAWCQGIVGQPNEERHHYFEQLDNRDGLSNSFVNDIFIDDDNLLWIATWDGLNMYDGNSLHVFNYSHGNLLEGIGNNVVKQISQDKQGNIWLGTVEGVSSYNKETGRFHNFFYSKKGDGQVSEQKPLLAVDTAGQMYCITKDAGFTRYDPDIQAFRSLEMPAKDGEIRKFIFDSKNRIWVLYDHFLYVYEIHEGVFKQVSSFEESSGINSFFHVNGKILVDVSGGKLYKIETENFQKSLAADINKAVSSVVYYNGNYLLTWADSGYSVYDSDFKSAALAGNLQALTDIKINSMAVSRENMLWLGTDGSGIIKIVRQPQYFGKAPEPLASYPGLIRQVRSFCEAEGDLWIGTKGNGIVVIHDFEFPDGKNTGYTQYTAPAELEHNVVYALEKVEDEAILIAGDAEGIMLYDLKAKRFVKWAEIEGSSKVPLFRYVFAILEDADNSLWLGTSGDGLIQIKLARQTDGNWKVNFLNQYKSGNSEEGPINNTIYSLIEGNRGRIWVGCRYGGLSIFDKKSKQFRNISSFSHEGSLSNNDVLALYKDKQNTIWVGTSYGLNWISEDSISAEYPVFGKITAAEGLPNNTIHSIIGDQEGNIWASTNNGLAMINLSDSVIARYYASDGLQGNEFSDGAVWMSPDGHIFWGGVQGFNYVLPENIPRDTWLPNLLLSNLQLASGKAAGNDLRVIYPGGNEPTRYVMSPQHNFFEFHLNALSFLSAGKCEFAYYLEGHDKKWNYSGTSGRIAYSNIPPGDYLLKIRWSNGKGVWSEDVLLFDMTIRQYIWLSSGAFLLYSVLLASGLLLFYRYRNHKQEMRHQLEVEHLLRQKDEELYRERLDFFTNITHELQTPLTLISGAVERCMRQEADLSKKSHFLQVIYQQAGRLTYLIHQLLEFRKAEAGYLAPRYEKMDISLFLTATAGLFTSWSDQKLIRFMHEVEAGMLAGMDRDKLEKITFNLLSNAFKHSPRKEQVVLTAKLIRGQKDLEISISNSGCHIPGEKLGQLFKKFTVLNESSPDRLSTGIGLAYVHELVRLLNGKITVSAEHGWVTFRVVLPVIPEQEITETALPASTAYDGRSYLIGALNAFREPPDMQPAEENNKFTLLHDLEQHDKKKILLVEDEPQIRYLLRDILEDHYIVYEAENGKIALGLLARIMPDLIISDVMMPVMDGLEFCETVKNMQATCHIPVVMLSAKGAIDQKTEGYEAGADAYVPKPFSTEFLLVRIRKLLEYREKMHSLFRQDEQDAQMLAGSHTGLAKEDKHFLDQLSGLIQEHLDDPALNSAFLEARLHISKMQLYRRLKSMSGMTPSEFIKHMRLQHAARMLKFSKLTVSEIIYQSGFGNPSYFFREFKKRYNCSPGDYKARYQIQV